MNEQGGEGLPPEAEKVVKGALPRKLTEAELERQQREAMGFYDSDKHRKEIIRIKAMSPAEREQAALANEYTLLELQNTFGDWAQSMMKKIKDSENSKVEFGRGVVTRSLSTIARYLTESQRLSLDREKFAWARQVYEQQKSQDFTSDLASGIIVDIQVKETGGAGGNEGGGATGTEGEAP